MARVTVEDCIDKIPNRFELVLLTAHRARNIAAGQPLTIERDHDKNPVVALREIAEKTVKPNDLKETLINQLQKQVEVDEPEPGAAPVIAADGTTRPALGQDDQASDTQLDLPTMTEEQLLRAMGTLAPSDQSNGGGRSR